MYQLLFGDVETDEYGTKRGMIQLIRDTLKEGFKGVVDTIAKEFWDPLKRMLFTDFQNGGLAKSIKASYNNFVQNLPWNKQEETPGESGSNKKESSATGGGAGFFGAPHFAKGRLNKTGGKVLLNGKWRNVNNLTEEERKAATTGFYKDANGQWVVMHEGETEIVPAHQNKAGQKVDAKDENRTVVDLYAKAIQLGNTKLADQIAKLTDLTKEQLDAEIKIKESTAKTAEETEKANKANDVEKKGEEKTGKGEEKVKGVTEYMKEAFNDVVGHVSAHLFGENKDENGKQKPIAEQIADMFAKGGRKLTNYFFGKVSQWRSLTFF
jgi:hypothetical protein